jgi:hypothetical protein
VNPWFSHETIDPLDPYSGNKTKVKFHRGFLECLGKNNAAGHKNLITAIKVLDAPNRIFYGTRELNDGGWCYIGKPDDWYLRVEVITPFPPNMVFAIYMTDDLSVYNLRAEFIDPIDVLSPLNWGERYERLIWKKEP